MTDTDLSPEDNNSPTFIRKVGRGVLKGAKACITYGIGESLYLVAMAVTSPYWIPRMIWDHYHEESEKNLKRWVRKDPSNPDLHLKLGKIYERQYEYFKEEGIIGSLGDLTKAIAEFEKVIAIDRNSAVAYYHLAECTNDPKKRFDYMRKAVKIDPDAKPEERYSSTVLDHLWGVVSDATDSETANQVVSKTLGREYRKHKDLEAKLDEFESGVEDFEEKLIDSSFDSELMAEYARFLRENTSSAVEDFVGSKLRELIQRDPRNSALYYEYGKFAETTLRDSFALLPAEEHSLYNLLIAYEDPDFNVEDWGFYFKIIEHYLATGDYGKAETAFLRGFGVCPDSPPLDSVQGRWIWTRYKEIRYAKAMIRGNESEAKTATFPEELRKKVDLIGALKVGNLSDLGKMLLGDDDDDLDEYYDIKPENRVPLAKELNSLGLYDEAIRTLECMKNRGTEAELLLADSYECKWRETGDREFLGKAHREIFTYTDMDTCVKRIRFARYLGWPDDLENVSLINAQKLADEAPPGTYETQLEEIRRHLGKNEYLKRMVADAEGIDPEKRVSILTEVVEQASVDFAIEHDARSKLAQAHEKYAPLVEERMRETVASLAGL